MKTKINIPYGRQWIEEEEINAVISVMRSPLISQGPKIAEFESKFAESVGAKYAVAVANGTAALHLSLLSLGLKPGDEVITTPLTFLATANSILYADAKPIFADAEEKYFCLNPEEVLRKINARTKAIIVVHMAGHPADLSALSEICQRHNLTLVEDASHALGAKYQGQSIGNGRFSKVTTFSFHPVKHLTTGEGGMIATNDSGIYERLLNLRNHGLTRNRDQFIYEDEGPWYYEMQALGFNYRITDIQCAIGLCQLSKLESFVRRRREIAQKYFDAFHNLDGIKLPEERKDSLSAYHLFVLRLQLDHLKKNRKEIFEALREEGLGVQVHYVPITHHPYYRNLGYRAQDFPVVETYYASAISIPIFPKMTEEEVDYVIKTVREVIGSCLK